METLRRKYLPLAVLIAVVICLVVYRRRNAIAYESQGQILKDTPHEPNVFETRSPLPVEQQQNSSVNKTSSTTKCSNEVLLEYIRQTGSYPSEGHWEGDHFLPKLCSLNTSPIAPNKITKCFQRNNIRRVVTMGDSNGNRFSKALLGYLPPRHESCSWTSMESMRDKGFLPEAAYYARDNMKLKSAIHVTTQNRCPLCQSRRSECTSSDPDAVEFEHIGLAHMRYNILQIDKEFMQTANVSAETYQEFIFKVYLKDRTPDLILIFCPFVHMVHNKNEIKAIKYFIDLLTRYLPEDSTVYWIPAFAGFQRTKDKNHKKPLPKDAITTNKLFKLNADLYKNLYSLLLEKPSQMKGFFDLIDMSLDRGDWSTDGVHMEPVWYKEVTKYLLQLICS